MKVILESLMFGQQPMYIGPGFILRSDSGINFVDAEEVLVPLSITTTMDLEEFILQHYGKYNFKTAVVPYLYDSFTEVYRLGVFFPLTENFLR